MNWTGKWTSQCWNKAYQEYCLESGLSSEQVSDFIKVCPYVSVIIEDRAIEFLNENQL